MGHYTYIVIAAIILLCGLTYLLSSCTTEVEPDKPPTRTEKWIPVNFTLTIGTYSNEEVEGRKAMVSESVRVADNILMYATLEDEHPVTTRAASTNLPVGTNVRMLAYNATSTLLVDTANYYVNAANELVPAGQGLAIPDDGASYQFAAYSFSTFNLPAQPGQTDVVFTSSSYADLDLLWGITTVQTVSGPETVTITVNHLFSRVFVEMTTADIVLLTPPTTVNITEVTSANVNPHYNGELTLNAYSGNLSFTPGSTNNPGNGKLLNRWRNVGTSAWGSGTGLSAQTVESDTFIVFTNQADTMALKISNLWVNNTTDLGEYQLRFTHTSSESKKFMPGHTYKLKLNFRQLVWAGSNIYWDGEKLTFLPEYAPPVIQGFQGVYFMWGSLVGISPNDEFSNDTTPLYVRIGSVWSNTQHAASGQNPWGGSTINQIPHITGGTLVSPNWLDDHSTRNYLSAEAHEPSNRVGDICKYLTETGDAPEGVWRMPNSREFGAYNSEYDITHVDGIWHMTGEDDGTTNFNDQPGGIQSFIERIVSSYIFPASGSRTANYGFWNEETFYLSGSPTSVGGNPNALDGFYSLYILGNTSGPALLVLNSAQPLGIQGPVRCVKTDLTGGARSFTLSPTADVEDWIPGGPLGDGDIGTGDVWY